MNGTTASRAEPAFTPALLRISRALRWALGALLGFVALNAFGGAVYGLFGARDVPREWLRGTPFDSYLVPSLVLGLVVGGGCLGACIGVLKSSRFASPLGVGAGVLLLGWIAVQVAMIGWVSWLQPAVAICGAVIVLIAAPQVHAVRTILAISGADASRSGGPQ